MNPWTALLVGILLGWLIEYAIDWFYWRRQPTDEQIVADLQEQLKASEERSAELEAQLSALGVSAAAGADVAADEDEAVSDDDIISEEALGAESDDDVVIIDEDDVEIYAPPQAEDIDETADESSAVNEDELFTALAESSAEEEIPEEPNEAHSHFEPEEFELSFEENGDISGVDAMESSKDSPVEQVANSPDADEFDSVEGGQES
jgi:hypothetical protein